MTDLPLSAFLRNSRPGSSGEPERKHSGNQEESAFVSRLRRRSGRKIDLSSMKPTSFGLFFCLRAQYITGIVTKVSHKMLIFVNNIHTLQGLSCSCNRCCSCYCSSRLRHGRAHHPKPCCRRLSALTFLPP